MANLTFNGQRLLFPGGGILDYKYVEALYQLFTFDTSGTTVKNLRVLGSSLSAENTPEWDFGDTTTDDTVNATISHTYTDEYVDPAVKTVTFSLKNPTDATTLYMYGNNPTYKNPISSVNLTNFTSLEILYIQNTTLSEIDLSNNPNITNLVMSGTFITSYDGVNQPNLTNLTTGINTGLTSIDITNNPDLTTLSVENSGLSTLDLTNNVNISTITAHSSNISTILFDTGSTYTDFGSLSIYDNSMTSGEVNTFIGHLWDLRDNLTKGFISINMGGTNADLSFESTHRVLDLQIDYGYYEGGSSYNIPDNIMKFGWASASSDTNVSNYFLLQSEYGPAKATIYGNSIASISESIDLEWNIYVDTNLTDFQSSTVSWRVRVGYRKHYTDSWIYPDNTLYTLTGNTSGFELIGTISLPNVTGINGTDGFGIQNQITLTDNRADKTQDSGDYMIVRVVPSISSTLTSAVVPYPNRQVNLNFTRTKWGD